MGWMERVPFAQLFYITNVTHLNERYPKSTSINDVNYYFDKDGDFTLIISTITNGEDKYQIDFVRADNESYKLRTHVAQLNISASAKGAGDMETPLKITTFKQIGNDERINRTLIVLRDEHIVHVIDTPESSHFVRTPAQFELSWFNPSEKTLILRTPDAQRLFHAEFFSEVATRVGKDIPYVWLSYVTDEATKEREVTSVLQITLFPEFAVNWLPPTPQNASNENASDATSSVSSPDLISVLNPLGLVGNPCPQNAKMNLTGDCSQARPSKMLKTEIGQGIRQLEVRNIPKVAWLKEFLPPGLSWQNWTTPSVNLLFIIEDTAMMIHAVDIKMGTEFEVRTELINQFELLGVAHRLAVSQNGLHALPIVEKYSWELESIERYNDICQKLKSKNLTSFDALVLEPWKDACGAFHRAPAASDFLQYLSLCPFGALCPSSNDYTTGGIYPGYHSPYPISMTMCQPGSICPLGIKRPCPYGFICPLAMQLLPTPCPADATMKGLTCFAEGLTAPIPAPLGLVPVYAHGPPLPSPPGAFSVAVNFGGTPEGMQPYEINATPGNFTVHPMNDTGLDYYLVQLASCPEGEYCPLGRDELENRKCPLGTYCPSSSGMLPIQCRYNVTDNFSSYCPEGSSRELPCPAGNFCAGPASIQACIKPYFCPPGTLSPTLCPAGSYCPNPSQKIICPKRHFCILGSISPTPCAVLSICPEGTKNNNANFILALVFLVVVAGLVVTWRVVEHRVNASRLERSRAMQQAEKMLAKAKLQQQSSGAASSDSDLNDPSNGAVSEYDSAYSDSEDDASASLLGGGRKAKNHGPATTASLAAQIDRDLNSRMPAVSYEVDIHFRDMGLMIKGTDKKVLDGVTGEVRHGRVTAVMGPSGAGKTTFMSTLAGKAHYGDRTGRIWLNDEKDSGLDQISKLVGFVPQDDIMLRELSVTEILKFNAKMRLASSLTAEEVEDVVRRNIRLLGLYDIRHELIGDETTRGISGGQRKRVNIGMELVANPSVLFLDEPTSGLDATASLQVCAILRRVAEEAGMTVVAVIHQPRYDIFTMFHDVLLLGKGGRTVYLGPTKDAVAYFETLGFTIPNRCNPADFLIDVVSGSVPRNGFPDFAKEDLFDLWIEHQKQGGNAPETDADPSDAELLVDYSDSESIGPTKSRAINGDTMDENAVDTFGSSSFVPPGRLQSHEGAQRNASSHSKVSKRAPPKAIKLGTKKNVDLEAFHHGGSVKSHGKRDTSGFFTQLWYFFVRSLLQQKRSWISILTDVILVLSSGITFGIVFLNSRYMGPPDPSVCASMPVEPLKERCNLPIEDPLPQIALMTIIGLALPASMAALRVFGLERIVFWRESSVGSNTASYFLGKELSYLPSSIILPLLYASIFYNFTVPRMGFGPLYLIFLVTWFCATGFALVISIIVPPSLATISTVVVIFGLSLFSSVAVRLTDLAKMWPPFSLISYVSFFRWLVEGYYTSEIAHWSGIYKIESGLQAMGYKLGNSALDFGIPIAMGVAMRIIALICLELMHRDQRK